MRTSGFNWPCYKQTGRHIADNLAAGCGVDRLRHTRRGSLWTCVSHTSGSRKMAACVHITLKVCPILPDG